MPPLRPHRWRVPEQDDHRPIRIGTGRFEREQPASEVTLQSVTSTVAAMSAGDWTVFCGECSLRLDEAHDAELGTRLPCPECGSYDRAIRHNWPHG